ncbi:MAG TPA: hypothetical protein PKA88_03270 [Polyangiaceae bacterium]|nr:hypothetical protein [Polyangiaceae bacterium]
MGNVSLTQEAEFAHKLNDRLGRFCTTALAIHDTLSAPVTQRAARRARDAVGAV